MENERTPYLKENYEYCYTLNDLHRKCDMCGNCTKNDKLIHIFSDKGHINHLICSECYETIINVLEGDKQ